MTLGMKVLLACVSMGLVRCQHNQSFQLMPAGDFECPPLAQIVSEDECRRASVGTFQVADVGCGCTNYGRRTVWSGSPSCVYKGYWNAANSRKVCQSAYVRKEMGLSCPQGTEITSKEECAQAAILLSDLAKLDLKSVPVAKGDDLVSYGCAMSEARHVAGRLKFVPYFNLGSVGVEEHTNSNLIPVCRARTSTELAQQAVRELQMPGLEISGSRHLLLAGLEGAKHSESLISLFGKNEEFTKAALAAFGSLLSANTSDSASIRGHVTEVFPSLLPYVDDIAQVSSDRDPAVEYARLHFMSFAVARQRASIIDISAQLQLKEEALAAKEALVVQLAAELDVQRQAATKAKQLLFSGLSVAILLTALAGGLACRHSISTRSLTAPILKPHLNTEE